MHSSKPFACAYLILALLLQPDASGQELGAPESAAGQNGENRTLHTGLAVTGGCVGGAVLGTVVPIFGNLVGCALGGVTAWWFARDKPPKADPPSPQPL